MYDMGKPAAEEEKKKLATNQKGFKFRRGIIRCEQVERRLG
jgi:hypothetical protein